MAAAGARDFGRLVFDRSNGTLDNAGGRQRLGIFLLRAFYRLSTPFGRLGISRVSKLIGSWFLPSGDTTYLLGRGARFTIPSGDYFWSVLYVRNHSYEPELGVALDICEKIDFAFLDIGANYGFWSVLASSPEHGSKPTLSVEASARTYRVLAANADENSQAFRPIHRAIWSVPGEEVRLFGDRHAGLSAIAKRTGVSEAFEVVKTTTIDEIVAQNHDFVGERPLVIKLDVEGVEIKAIEGAELALQREFLLIVEEDKWENFGGLVKQLRDTLGCRLYFFDRKDARMLSVQSNQQIADVRLTERHVRQAGFNFFAAKAGSCFDLVLSEAVKARA
jgi:FkbM family methyltransferase